MELLMKMYEIDAPSHRCEKMTSFVSNWIKENVPSAIVSKDKSGNLLVTKGKSDTYPVLCAHLDEVSHQRGKNYHVLRADDLIIGWDYKTNEQRGLGADDRNGIWVALQCLKKYDAIKCAFFVDEEVGSNGSNCVDMKFFDDARWVIQSDRRNSGDFISNYSGTQLCSKEFIEDCNIKQFGYKQFDGSSTTDVKVLKAHGLKVSCANISCGYYNEHTEREFTRVSHLQACLSLVQYAIENCTKVYTHEYKEPKRTFSEFDYFGGRGIVCSHHANKKTDVLLHPIFDEFVSDPIDMNGFVMASIEIASRFNQRFEYYEICQSYKRWMDEFEGMLDDPADEAISNASATLKAADDKKTADKAV